MANTLENTGRGAATGAAAGSFGGPLGTVGGAAIGAIGGALGLGSSSKKVVRDDASTWGNRYNTVDAGIYNRYNDLVRQWNADNPNQYAEGDDVHGVKKVKSKNALGRSRSHYYDQYGLGNQSGNQTLDQYANYLLGGGTQGANDWLAGQRKSYSDAMGSAADQAVRDYMSGYKSNQGTAVNNAQSSAYDEAKAKLDAQKAYGYLSDVGYQKALDKLNSQTGNVRAAMNDAYSAQLQNWEDNLNQMYAKATGGIGAWDFANPFTENALYKDAVNNAANYAGTSMSDDVLNSLLSNVDLYTPDQWIAYGAGSQGQYNPLSDFSTTGRRKKNVTSTEGINEV